MVKTRNDVYRYTTDLYKFLRSGHGVQFKKMRVYRGEIDTKTHAIVLDHRDEIVSTLVHEYLHHRYPNWAEKQVLEAETVIMTKLSQRQICNIIKELAAAL